MSSLCHHGPKSTPSTHVPSSQVIVFGSSSRRPSVMCPARRRPWGRKRIQVHGQPESGPQSHQCFRVAFPRQLRVLTRRPSRTPGRPCLWTRSTGSCCCSSWRTVCCCRPCFSAERRLGPPKRPRRRPSRSRGSPCGSCWKGAKVTDGCSGVGVHVSVFVGGTFVVAVFYFLEMTERTRNTRRCLKTHE